MWLQSLGSPSGQQSVLLLPPCGSGCMRGLGRLASQTSLPPLPFTSDSAMSDSSARLCLAWGRSRGLRPALRAPLRGRASGFLLTASLSPVRHRSLSPIGPLAGRRGPVERALSKATCPPPIGFGSAGFAPTLAPADHSASLRDLSSCPVRLPHQAGRLDRGLWPPLPRLTTPTPLRYGIGVVPTSAAPR